MATYNELKSYIKTIKGNSEAVIDGKTYKGTALKSFLISKLSNPQSVEIEQPFTQAKPILKPKENKTDGSNL